MKIVTHHVYPPIPTRNCDWCAVTENYEPGSPMGEAPTEGAAISDLLSEYCMARGADTDSTGGCLLCFALAGKQCRAEFTARKENV